MKIAILGTGLVGATIASKLLELGHEVFMGSRTATNPKLLSWKEKNQNGLIGTFEEASNWAHLLFNCTQGTASIEALNLAGEANLIDKILIDVSNPLDFTNGMPPVLSVCNTDSLGEQIQRRFPKTQVVKTLNTVNCSIMVNPNLIPGEHDLFVSGNDSQAKTQVKEYLRQWFGWKTVIDLGDISTSRGTEQWLALWVRLWGSIGHSNFNLHIKSQMAEGNSH